MATTHLTGLREDDIDRICAQLGLVASRSSEAFRALSEVEQDIVGKALDRYRSVVEKLDRAIVASQCGLWVEESCEVLLRLGGARHLGDFVGDGPVTSRDGSSSR